jgi:hypothetical protein
MPAKTSKLTDPFAAIDAIVAETSGPTGPEWFTIAQYTKRYGGNREHNMRRLKKDPRFVVWSDPARRKPNKYKLK